MDKTLINTVRMKVYQLFPRITGVIPEIKSQPHDTYLFIFRSNGTASDNKIIPIDIRVIADANGRVLKTSSSR
jgi:hypothetical protein